MAFAGASGLCHPCDEQYLPQSNCVVTVGNRPLGRCLEGERVRRCRFLLLVSVTLLLAGGLALWLFFPQSRVTRAGFEALRVGMTMKDVERVLGGPPGDYRTGDVDLDLSRVQPEFDNVMFAPEVLLGERHFEHEWWQGDGGTVWVCFDEEGRVVTKEFTPGELVASTPHARFRRWLGW